MNVRSCLAGASAAITIGSTSLAAFALLYPTEGMLGPLARILDAYSPWFFSFGLLSACITVALGCRLLGVTLMAGTIACGITLFSTYLHLTVPANEELAPNIRALFFNAQGGNTEFSDRIVSAAAQLDPDIIVFAEASAVFPSIDRLREEFSFVSPCTVEKCELLIATNLSVRRFWHLQLNPAWPERYAVIEFETPDGRSAFLAAMHLVKPWMSGIAEPELARLTAQLNWFDGPVVALGDFNMAPWSRPMRQLVRETGFQAIRGQPATWPASSNVFRIPTGLALVGGGINVARIMPFGEGMNSNHLGLVADLSLPQPSE